MEQRQSPAPLNRNPRVGADIKPAIGTKPLVNPFTGMAAAAHVAKASSPSPAKAGHVSAPAPTAAQPSSSSAPPASVAAQIVAPIPVALPGQGADASTPTRLAGAAQKQDDLDRILEAVNSRVGAPSAPVQAKAKAPAALAKKAAAGGGKLKNKLGAKKPVGAILATLAVAIMLSITAVFAYRQGAGSRVGASSPKVGTSSSASSSISEAGNLLVRPSDLDDYSQSLQTKINGLNDSQDFNQQPLSDQMLGL
jgi:hypothetical protein